jgi:nickel/cobalt exporter
MGSAWLVPRRVEAYLGVGTGLLVIAIGLWMLRTQLSFAVAAPAADHAHARGAESHAHDPAQDHGQAHDHSSTPDHEHEHGSTHVHADEDAGYHSHGWGRRHSHAWSSRARPGRGSRSCSGSEIVGGLRPDPGPLAILLAALASGKIVLGLFTVVVFSIGFASALVVVGVVAARVGEVVLTWLSGRWVAWLQIGAALLIVAVGLGLTANAWRSVMALH